MPRKRLPLREMNAEPDGTPHPVATRRSMLAHSGSAQDVALDQARSCHLCEGDKYVVRCNGCRVRFCIPCMQGQAVRIGHDCLCSLTRQAIDLSLTRQAIDLGYTGQVTSVSRRAIIALRFTRRWQRSEWVQWVASYRYRTLAATCLRSWREFVDASGMPVGILSSSDDEFARGRDTPSSDSDSSSVESEYLLFPSGTIDWLARSRGHWLHGRWRR
jgi:hypothetical protein